MYVPKDIKAEQIPTQTVLAYFQKLVDQSLIDIDTIVNLIVYTTTEKELFENIPCR